MYIYAHMYIHIKRYKCHMMPLPPRGQHRTPGHSQRHHPREARRQRRLQRRGQRQDLAA